MTSPPPTTPPLSDTPPSINSSTTYNSLSSTSGTAGMGSNTASKRSRLKARGLIGKKYRRAGMVARGCPRTSTRPVSSSPSRPSPSMMTREELVEMRRLAALLPPTFLPSATAKMSRSLHGGVDPLAVLNSTMRYIDQLTSTVVARVQNGTLPTGVLGQLAANRQLSATPPAAPGRRRVKRNKCGRKKPGVPH